jgi:hypothetical protein
MIDIFSYVLLVLASYRITRAVTTDTIFESAREKVWKKYPPSTKLGYLITCNWCTGFWISLVVVGCYLLVPYATYVVSLVLSTSALVGIISSKAE